ncbi:MAG TPA: PrpF domain-containing protein [Burkholderiales bacterium]|nr:PrpF domain-containing protein [Burkholderiales bacterium]
MLKKIPAVFMRGGTSKALMFHSRDLPADRKQWDDIFTAAMGSPDPNGRQLNGMGGGISSLSKVCVLAPSEREDADVDYTFAQVLIKDAQVDYSGNCGNMSSAVGPFAVEEGIVSVSDGEATVRIYNTNTKKVIHSTFTVKDGRAITAGDLPIPGVGGTGAPVRLDFLNPGGASTGKLLPTGNAVDVLDVPGLGSIRVSMIDAANAVVFVAAEDLGLTGREMPDALDADVALLEKLAAIRVQASLKMGIGRNVEEARAKTAVPYVGFVSGPQDARTLSGDQIRASDIDVTARMISNGQPHRALPLTASLCTAVAARIEGSIVWQASRRDTAQTLRIGMPSGVLTVGADVQLRDGAWHATRGSFFRTQRRLFDGYVYVPLQQDAPAGVREAA